MMSFTKLWRLMKMVYVKRVGWRIFLHILIRARFRCRRCKRWFESHSAVGCTLFSKWTLRWLKRAWRSIDDPEVEEDVTAWACPYCAKEYEELPEPKPPFDVWRLT